MSEPTYIAGILQEEALGRGQVFWLNKPKDGTHLYTHPVKEQDTDCQYCKQGCIRCDARKQLTDEEILAVWDNDCVVLDEDKLVIRFARAILRKANEK